MTCAKFMGLIGARLHEKHALNIRCLRYHTCYNYHKRRKKPSLHFFSTTSEHLNGRRVINPMPIAIYRTYKNKQKKPSIKPPSKCSKSLMTPPIHNTHNTIQQISTTDTLLFSLARHIDDVIKQHYSNIHDVAKHRTDCGHVLWSSHPSNANL